jgi:hypothetical protein
MQEVDMENVEEFRHAWNALKGKRSVFLDIEVPDSRLEVRVRIARADTTDGEMPRAVSIHCETFVSSDEPLQPHEESMRLTAELVCREAVTILCEAVGATVLCNAA